ncbi:MAG: glycoside-pentoside-hexuronide (GPH):cation symporter [Clostridiales bacterium]|jgi:sugar (glycoside-pentoside-hexuronide) transporter|nr:glycoside-pentoside-hexuronide (GPH):cation symporter [Clostridiales bacterium]
MDSPKTPSKINLHKIFGTKPGEGMQPKEAISYGLAGFGQNLICTLTSSFLVYYFTNGLLIPSMTVGLIMLFVRLFDALNDPIMGSIVDKTNTKYGKCRPYLLWMPIPIAVLTVAMFLPYTTFEDNASGYWMVAIITAIYVIWSIVYTIVDVPYWGLASSMTKDTHQRGTVLMVARLLCTIGAGVTSLLMPFFSNGWISDYMEKGAVIPEHELDAASALQGNYWIVVLVICLIALPFFFLGFKNTKERFFAKEDVRPLKENLKLLSQNKPLLIIIISGLLGSARIVYMFANMYLAQYNVGAVMGDDLFLGMTSLELAVIITLLNVPGGLVATLLVPWCTKKFGKRKTYIYTHIFGGLVMIATALIGWDQKWKLVVNMVGLGLVAISHGFANVTSYAMIADTVDYLELKTGKRAEGICFAVQTFLNKIGMAVGAAVICFGLGWAGIDPKIAATTTIDGNFGGLNLLYMLCVLVPGISIFLSVIPFFFYKFNEKEQAAAVAEIAKRRGIDMHGNKVAGAE